MSSWLSPITGTTFLQVLAVRIGSPFVLIWFIPTFFVAMLDLRLEQFDFQLARCVDGASRDQYWRFDKIFDGMLLVVFTFYNFVRWYMSRGQPNAFFWTWVPVNIALAVYRFIGICIIVVTGSVWLNAVFPNFWWPYVWFFTFLQYTHTYAWAKRTTWFWYLFIIGIAVYKMTEELLHFVFIDDSPEADQEQLEKHCRMYTDTPSNSDVLYNFWVSLGLLIPIFLAIALRKCVDYNACVEQRRAQLKPMQLK